MFAKHKLRSFRSPPARKKIVEGAFRRWAIRVKSTARKWHEDEIHTLRIVKEFDIIFIRCTYIRIDLYIFLERVDKCGFLLSLLSKYPPLKNLFADVATIFLKGRERGRGERERERRKETHEK